MRRQGVVCVQLPVGQADHLHQGQITRFKNTLHVRLELAHKEQAGESCSDLKRKPGTPSKEGSSTV